ncbi:disease resistance protein RGA2-like [Triticum urartu]|uniref:disease resistance protein RGA2-like n=1 Tax=Triticum urartu TaxID=4572 RepID=UPI002043E2F5|nr:disease resistance protein RGA2-like [Triticum urartu]
MSPSAIGIVGAINECVTLFQWAKSAISSLHSRWSGSQKQRLQDHVLQLERGLQRMRDTLPAMYDLINKAEWRSHEHCVAKLLPCLKDAVYEAEDLLDEFTWYEKKVQVEGNASQSPFTDFFHIVIEGSFDEVNDVQSRLDHLSSMLDNLGLHGIAQRFDKLVRPETTSLPNETKIFGRAKELKQVLGLLGVPTCPKRKRTTSSIDASTRTSTKSRISSLPVLVIAGIGGVGKTTLAQHVCNHPRVRSHFDLIIWICVSDDFDVKRLTKEVIQSCTKKEGANDNLNSLQHALSNHVNNKRLLIVLDDMWDDSLKENGQCWKRFCAPFRNVQEGSMILVTTRCPNVTEGVRTMEHVIVEGLKDGVFWNFFKLCAFGSESSDNDPELERIGQRILPKLKGSPLAAKTLGRMLKMDLQASHWNSIVESELWELKQKETDILPALRLSYMYLPFYLKQCFAFCAVYPKDYKFEKACLAEIWVAEGFVEPQGGVPIQDIFSEHDCFILQNKSDFDKVPQNVRHLYILYAKKCKLQSLPAGFDKLTSLQKFELNGLTIDSANNDIEVLEDLQPPTSLKHLYVRKYVGVSLPSWFQPQNLPSLQSLDFKGCVGLKSINLNEIPAIGTFLSLTKLCIDGCKNLSSLEDFLQPSYVPGIKKIEIKDCKMLASVPTDIFGGFHFLEELCIVNCPNICQQRLVSPSLKELSLCRSSLFCNIDCCSLTSFHCQCEFATSIQLQTWSLPALKRLEIWCKSLTSIGGSLSLSISTGTGNIRALSSLTVLVMQCEKLSTLDGILTQEYLPAIETIYVNYCDELLSLPVERFVSFPYLKRLRIWNCPSLSWQRGLVLPSHINVEISRCPKLEEVDEINGRTA